MMLIPLYSLLVSPHVFWYICKPIIARVYILTLVCLFLNYTLILYGAISLDELRFQYFVFQDVDISSGSGSICYWDMRSPSSYRFMCQVVFSFVLHNVLSVLEQYNVAHVWSLLDECSPFVSHWSRWRRDTHVSRFFSRIRQRLTYQD